MEGLLIPSNIAFDLDATESTIINKLTSNTKNVTKLSKDLRVLMSKTNNGTRQMYLLFKIIEREDITLFVLRYCFKDYNEYDSFIKSGEAKNPDCYKSETEDVKIEAKLAELNETGSFKTPLPNSMRVFESERDFSNKTQSYIFEMEDWIKSTKGKEIHPIFDALQGIVINHKESNYGKGWFYLNIKDLQDFKILFRYKENANNTHYYLFEVTDDIQKSISEIEKKNTYNGELLLQSAVRGYPDWIMYDDYQSWSNIENDKKANLALSDEEVKVLNGAQYPLFINGLAGSGKSTILYYLFANAFASDEQEERKFLFLSYSKNLTDEAKRVIKALYCTNPHINNGKKIKNKTKEDKQKLDEKFAKYFKTFQEFIKEKFLNDEEKNSLFSKAQHTNYDTFQELYRTECKLQRKSQYSPNVVWSVIRTFIKGRKSDQYITTDDYAQIERDDRTVTIEDFKNIEEIYKKWYKKYWETEERWDDLDLIRYVLNKKKITPEFDIIFCDEAQDFTPIENRLILSMSKYSKYDLSDFKQIPIAYAGDPNQTISPTGFKWERLKDIFNKSFKEHIGDYMSLDICPLNNNYRSKKAIVQFANSLQYLRKCFLTKDELVPQCLWNPIGNLSPLFYYEEEIKDILMEGLNKSSIILNGEDDEEAYKNDEDGLLLNVSNQEKILTAITAKGLEADAVILYRFADKMPESFSKIFKSQELVLESERYECMHFLTKLYIAVSRAKKVLYIIDTNENYKKLWHHFIDNDFINNILLISRSKDIDIWGEKDNNGDSPMGGISLGRRDEFIQKLKDNYKPGEIAEDIFAKAKINEDAREMKRAKGYFEEDSNTSRAKECDAYYYWYKQDFETAGDIFSDIDVNATEEATQAYWEGQCWNKIALSNDLIKRTCAQYYLKEKSLTDLLKIKDFAQNFDIQSDTYYAIAHRIEEDVEKFNSKNLFFKLTELLEELAKRGFKFLKGSIAMLYYKNEEFAKAVKIWEDINLTASKAYYDAKALLAPNDNNKIYWLFKGGKREEILSNYSSISAIKEYNLNEDSIKIVFNSLLSNKNNYIYALNYPYNGKDKNDLLYNTNPLQFVDKSVLDDYSEGKYVDYVENKIKNSDKSIFDKPLSVAFFKKVFNLGNDHNGKPIWIKFLKLRDKTGNRVLFKNQKNVDFIFEALSAHFKNNNNIYTASCFIEMLFSMNYSYQRASKYKNAILSMFEGTLYLISKKDFETSRNSYFSQCGINGSRLDSLRNNLFEFATNTLQKEPYIEKTDIILIYKIIEKTAKYKDIDKLYRFGLNDTRFALLFGYFHMRLAVNNLHSDKPTAFTYFLNTINIQNLSLKQTIDTFDRDDSAAFIGKALAVKQKLTTNDKTIIAELFYKDAKLQIKDIITTTQQKEDIINELEELITKGIDSLLSSHTTDTYHLQLMYFTFERIHADDINKIADLYDNVIRQNALNDYPDVLDFIKERALYRWKWINSTIAEVKKEEYNYTKDIDDIEPYPTIKDSIAYDNKPIVITKDREIDGISIQLQINRKTIWISDGTNDILEIRKGQIEISDYNRAKQNGQQVTIDNSFKIEVESDGDLVNLTSGGKQYQIKFNN